MGKKDKKEGKKNKKHNKKSEKLLKKIGKKEPKTVEKERKNDKFVQNIDNDPEICEKESIIEKNQRFDVRSTEKIELLKKVSIFSQLQQSELEFLATYSDYYRYKAGYTIFATDSLADELFVIKSGSVNITKKISDGKIVDIAKFIPGESFGETDLLDTIPRQATATAEIDTEVLIFPKKNVIFQEILYENPAIFAPILYKLMQNVNSRIRQVNKTISENTPWISDLRKVLYKDKLTGLYNLTFLEDEYRTLLPTYGKESALVFVKPDNFKDINDNYGHEVGDNALVFLAQTEASFIRDDDIPVRYKGNEVAIIMPHTTREEATVIAESIISGVKAINIAKITNGEDFHITMSAGIAMYPEETDNDKALIELSYERLYRARNLGGDRIVCK